MSSKVIQMMTSAYTCIITILQSWKTGQLCLNVLKIHANKFGHVLRLFGTRGLSFISFTLCYRLPEPSMEPTQGRFLAEMRFPILLLSGLLRPSSWIGWMKKKKHFCGPLAPGPKTV